MTYENAYEILSEVRRGINEYSTAYVQGTDTTGAYSNDDIMRKINDAHKYLYDLLVNREPQLFYKKTTLTPANSVLTMPADFYRIRRLENSSGLKITEIPLEEKSDGSQYFYYWRAGTIYIDQESFTEAMTLYYVSRPRELIQGMSSAGGSLSLTLATTAKKIVDYYNGMTIENITDNWVDTISDYATTLVAILAAQTGAANKYYGLVSELPEAFHSYIGRKATLLMRITYKSLEKPTVLDVQLFNEDLTETIKSYFGTNNTNQDFGELFQ
jgi:hypothetical protein